MSATRTTNLERHNGRWRVVVAVPRTLREHLGKSHLKKSLHTGNLATANLLKADIVADFKRQIEEAMFVIQRGPEFDEARAIRKASALALNANVPFARLDLPSDNAPLLVLKPGPIPPGSAPFMSVPTAAPVGTTLLTRYKDEFASDQGYQPKSALELDRALHRVGRWLVRRGQWQTLEAVTPELGTAYAFKNLPFVGALQKEYRDMLMGKMGPEQQAHAYGQMFVGSLALAAAGMATSQRKLTGGGPNEPNLRKAMEAIGWKPYSVVIDNGDGTHTYAPYNRFDPVGLLFGIAADVTEMMVTYPERENQADNVALAAVMAVVNNIKDKTYLQSMAAALDAITDPEKNATKWVGQVGESLIPFSSLLRNANPDPYMREARTLMDHLIDRMPGFSQNLPPRRDPFGYPVKVQTGLVFQDNADDIVDAEQIRMVQETGRGIAIPTNYSREGIDLRDLAVERPDGTPTTAFDRLLEIAIQPEGFRKPMKEAVADVVRSESYQTAPDGHGDTKGTKLWLIQGIVTKYRDAAWKQLLREYPEEVGKPVGQRKAEVREAHRQKAQAGASGETMSQVQALLAGYGIR